MKDFVEYDVFFYKDGQRVRDSSATANTLTHPSIYATAEHLRTLFFTMGYDKNADFFVLIDKKSGATFKCYFPSSEDEHA